jgi:transposase-like protein
MELWDVDHRTIRRSCASARSGWSPRCGPDYPSDWPAIVAVAEKLGIGTAETLRKWVRQAEVDAGQRPGVSSEESAEIRRLKRENAELRRANEILKAASVFLLRGGPPGALGAGLP